MNNIKKFLKNLFAEYAPSYFLQAESGFPRLVYEVKQLYTDEPYDKFVVTINVYDRQTTADIDDVVDRIYDNIAKATYLLMMFFTNSTTILTGSILPNQTNQ